MKKIFSILVICCVATTVEAQTNQFVIQGMILDAQNDETIPYAVIKILSDEQTPQLVKVRVTDENGKFSETISQKGNYLLDVEILGKKSLRIPFAATDNQLIDFGIIRMDDDTQLLDEIVVSAQKLLVKIDLDKIQRLYQRQTVCSARK